MAALFSAWALILVSLHLLREAVAPLRESTVLPAVAEYIASDRLTGFLIGAALAFTLHSSVAAILMCVALSKRRPALCRRSFACHWRQPWQRIDPGLADRAHGAEPRRIPVANALLRGSAALATLYVIGAADLTQSLMFAEPATSLILLHIAFNLLLVLAFAPLTRFLEKPVRLLMPGAVQDAELATTLDAPLSAFDHHSASDPSVALSAIRQEILQMLEEVERMYRPIMGLYKTDTPGAGEALRSRDVRVNALFSNLRRFVAENARQQLDEPQLKQSRGAA